MKTNNWEDWMMGVSFAVATAAAIGFGHVEAPSFTSAANAAEQPAYVMTVTAKRLPAECKGLTGRAVPANCATLLDAQTISVRAVN